MWSINAEEIYFEIFLKVPLRSLFACKCVCKKWHSLISNPDFVKMQLKLTKQRNNPNLLLYGYKSYATRNRYRIYFIRHDSLDLLLSSTDKFRDYAVGLDFPFKFLTSGDDSIDLMGSCDGLVCLRLGIDNWVSFCLWNPATREYKKLPRTRTSLSDVDMVAFGYDYKNDDYKLVAGVASDFQVFSLGKNLWKSIENVPYDFRVSANTAGVFLNGDPHWLAKRKDSSSDDVLIITMDMSNEIFKEMQLPEEVLLDILASEYSLGVLEGCLCSLELNVDDQVKIGVMQNYGVRESWIKRYTVNTRILEIGCDPKIIWSFKSGEILFGGGGKSNIVVYDPKKGTSSEPNIYSSTRTQFANEELYFESLVSLKSGTYVGEEEQPNKKKRRKKYSRSRSRSKKNSRRS